MGHAARMPHVGTETLERSAALAATLIAPALLAAGWLAQPRLSGDAAAELAQIGGDPGRWRLAAVLLMLGALAAIPAAVSLAAPVRRRSEVGALSGMLLTAVGAVGLVALSALAGLHGAALAGDAGDPVLAPGAEAAWDGLLSGTTRVLVYSPEVLGAGIVLLGVAILWRAARGRAAGALIAAGGALVAGGAFVAQPVVAGAGALVLLAGTAALTATR